METRRKVITDDNVHILTTKAKIKTMTFYADEDIYIDLNQDKNEVDDENSFLLPAYVPFEIEKEDTETYEKVYQRKFEKIYVKRAKTKTTTIYYVIRNW